MSTLAPKRVKYRKMFKGQMPGMSFRANKVDFGEYGLLALSRGRVSAQQIESARKAMTHYTAKGGRVWIRIFPDRPVSKKPLDVRMGSGKGDIAKYVAVVRPGQVLFEIGGISVEMASEAIRRAGHKLPVQAVLIARGQ